MYSRYSYFVIWLDPLSASVWQLQLNRPNSCCLPENLLNTSQQSCPINRLLFRQTSPAKTQTGSQGYCIMHGVPLNLTAGTCSVAKTKKLGFITFLSKGNGPASLSLSEQSQCMETCALIMQWYPRFILIRFGKKDGSMNRNNDRVLGRSAIFAVVLKNWCADLRNVSMVPSSNRLMIYFRLQKFRQKWMVLRALKDGCLSHCIVY